MAESPEHQKLNVIKQKIDERKRDGLSEKEKEESRQELLQLKNEVQKSAPEDAEKIYTDIIQTWESLKKEAFPHEEERKITEKEEKMLKRIWELKTVKLKFEALSDLNEQELQDIFGTEPGRQLLDVRDENGMDYLGYTLRVWEVWHILVVAKLKKLEKKDFDILMSFVEKVKNDPDTKKYFFNGTNPNSAKKTREYVADLLLKRVTTGIVSRVKMIYENYDKLVKITEKPTPEIFAKESQEFIKSTKWYTSDVLPFLLHKTGISRENALKSLDYIKDVGQKIAYERSMDDYFKK